jgi:hypothetical protein
MSKPLYFDAAAVDKEHDELFCYPLEHFRDMLDAQLPTMRLYRAKADTGSGTFFCREFGEVGLKGESCGRQCDSYEPRNGKNGRCRHSAHCYEPTTEVVVITYNPTR